LQPEFPYENFNSRYYENVIKISFLTFLYLVGETQLFYCNRKTTQPADRCILHIVYCILHIPPNFIFPACNQSNLWPGVQMCPVWKSGSFCTGALFCMTDIICHFQLASLLYK
jgi:hypothetical protein